MRPRYALALLLLGLFVVAGCKRESAFVPLGPNAVAIDDLNPSGKTFLVKVETKGKKLKEGDPITFAVTSEKAGRVWVVQVDSEDNMDLLLPNDMTKANEIAAGGTISFPPADTKWNVVAEPPYGKSILACIVTTGDVDLSAALQDGGDKSKLLRLIGESPSWGVAKLIIEVGTK